MTTVLYVDGASFSNPGPSGLGVVLEVDGRVVLQKSVDAGWGTNNEAEYRALIEGLREALARGIRDLHVRGDSQLVISQMQDKWKVREKRLQALKSAARALASEFDTVVFEYIPRERNVLADGLSKAGAEAAKARGARPSEELLE